MEQHTVSHPHSPDDKRLRAGKSHSPAAHKNNVQKKNEIEVKWEDDIRSLHILTEQGVNNPEHCNRRPQQHGNGRRGGGGRGAERIFHRILCVCVGEVYARKNRMT